MPARLTISRASYSKNLIEWLRRRRSRLAGRSGREPVRLGQLGVLAREHFGELDHHLTLLPGGVVLHLAVDHVHAAAVGDRLDDLFGEHDLRGLGREDPLGDLDLRWMQRPRADAAVQEGCAELRFAALDVLDVSVGAIERVRAYSGAGVVFAI